MRQLAQWAGVSPAAVSLALRNHPSIPPSTRERIKQLAVAKGYRSDPVVASLMAQLRTARAQRGTERIALLTFWANAKQMREAMIHDYNYQHYVAGICDRAQQLGYEVDEFWAKEPGLTPSRLSKILHTRGIRGLVLAPLGRAHGHASLDWQHFATATITHTVAKPDVHRVTHSHFNGMQTALRQLKHRGYRRPGFVTTIDQNERVKRAWEGAFLAHQPSLPAKTKIPPLLIPALSLKEFRAWLAKHKPDVVISNLTAPLQMLQELGYVLPQEIGFASLDLAAGTLLGDELAAGVDQRPFLQGSATADLVIKQIQNNEFGLPINPVTLQLDGAWQDGATIRSPKDLACVITAG